MYAIVLTGGKQYKVTEGLVFETELLNAKENDTVNLEVLMVADQDKLVVGEEAKKATVEAVVVQHGKGKKINIFKMKPKKGYRRRQGHRQPYTKVTIASIKA